MYLEESGDSKVVIPQADEEQGGRKKDITVVLILNQPTSKLLVK